METAYIGLGGNVGNVIETMALALRKLDAHPAIEVAGASPVYRTPPWGIEDQDWFYNACAKLQTSLEPEGLLEECLDIEQYFKRMRRIRWGPRTLDIDILLYGDKEVATENLSVPHPRMKERAFVIQPLADLEPELVLEKQPVTEWLAPLEVENLELQELPESWWRTMGA